MGETLHCVVIDYAQGINELLKKKRKTVKITKISIFLLNTCRKLDRTHILHMRLTMTGSQALWVTPQPKEGQDDVADNSFYFKHFHYKY